MQNILKFTAKIDKLKFDFFFLKGKNAAFLALALAGQLIEWNNFSRNNCTFFNSHLIVL